MVRSQVRHKLLLEKFNILTMDEDLGMVDPVNHMTLVAKEFQLLESSPDKMQVYIIRNSLPL